MEEEYSGKMTVYKGGTILNNVISLKFTRHFLQTPKSVMSFTYSIQCLSQFGSVHNEPPSAVTMGPQPTQHSRPK